MEFINKCVFIGIGISFMFISCGGNSSKKGISNSVKDAAQSTSPKVDSTSNDIMDDGHVEWTCEDTTLISKKIPYNLYTFHDVSLGNPFSKDSALIKLFPGQYYKLWRNDTDSIVFEFWNCKACQKYIFHGTFDKEVCIFPLPDSNETQIGDTLLITQNGKKSILISFATTYLQSDFIGMGRFAGAYLGLALFQEENNKWNLKAFTPAVGVYGEFETIPKIHPFLYGKDNIGCYIGNNTQGGGGAGSIDAYFFSRVKHEFKLILEKEKVCRCNRNNNTWDTKFQVSASQSMQAFPDIISTTYGDYSLSGFDTNSDELDSPDEALDEIKQIAKHKDNFDFTIINHYNFQGNKYKLTGEDVTTCPHKDTKKKGFFSCD